MIAVVWTPFKNFRLATGCAYRYSIEISKYEGRSESNATRFLFMTLSFKGTQIGHHKKVYGMSIS